MALMIRFIALCFNIRGGEKTLDNYIRPIFQERLEKMAKLGHEYAKEVCQC